MAGTERKKTQYEETRDKMLLYLFDEHEDSNFPEISFKRAAEAAGYGSDRFVREKKGRFKDMGYIEDVPGTQGRVMRLSRAIVANQGRVPEQGELVAEIRTPTHHSKREMI